MRSRRQREPLDETNVPVERWPNREIAYFYPLRIVIHLLRPLSSFLLLLFVPRQWQTLIISCNKYVRV